MSLAALYQMDELYVYTQNTTLCGDMSVMLIIPWSVRLYGEIINSLERVDYLPYRRTDRGITVLYHSYQVISGYLAQDRLFRVEISDKGGKRQTTDQNTLVSEFRFDFCDGRKIMVI